MGLGVSCSADRQINCKITADGVFVEQLRNGPGGKYLPDPREDDLDAGDVVAVNLNRPMSEIRELLSACSVSTRLKLTGPLIVARDIAHAKIKERLDAGEGMPQYMKDHAVYYAGPAKTPDGMASGFFGPTTAGRMDPVRGRCPSCARSMVMPAGIKLQDAGAAAQQTRGFTGSMAGSPPSSPGTTSRRWRCWSTRSSAWRRCGKSRLRISPALRPSLSPTRELLSSYGSRERWQSQLMAGDSDGSRQRRQSTARTVGKDRRQ